MVPHEAVGRGATDFSQPESAKDVFRKGYFRTWDTARPHPLRKVYAKELSLAIDRLAPHGKRVLDLGCGPGRFAIAFASMGATLVSAVDISPKVLEAARKRAEDAGVTGRMVFCAGDVENLPYRDSSFDAVSCMQTFVHFPEPERAAQEMFRVCRHGGSFIATATNQDRAWVWRYPSVATAEVLLEAFPEDLRAAILRIASSGAVGRALRLDMGFSAPHRGFTMPTFRHLFEQAGFGVKEEIEIGRPAVFLFLSGRKD
jgi:ubiquinone/menaquinone biosynthesis C-methylase UbiE